MVRHLIETDGQDRAVDDALFVDEAKWNTLTKQFAKFQIGWNEKEQSYRRNR